MRLQTNDWVPRGSIYLIADYDDPEVSVFDPVEEVDGTVAVCHPDDEQTVRDTLAAIGEHRDLNEWAAAVRQRRAVL